MILKGEANRLTLFNTNNPLMPDYLINDVYPWGRSLEEYERMFSLTPEDLQGRILDCCGGPASFNAELTARGGAVVSCDPLYQFSKVDIARRVEECRPILMENVRANSHQFVWHTIKSVEQLEETRMSAMRRFLEDYESGMNEQRYVTAALPTLPFADSAFDLAVVSHMLFLYSEEYDRDFHLQSVKELIKVAKEVRIFPLLGMRNIPSPHLEPVMEELRQTGCYVETVKVDYEFMVGGDRMLLVRPY